MYPGAKQLKDTIVSKKSKVTAHNPSLTMADTEDKPTEEAAIIVDEEALDAVDNTTKEIEEEAAAGGGGKSFIVYYNALRRVAMAAFLIAAGTYAVPDVFLGTPNGNFQYCGE